MNSWVNRLLLVIFLCLDHQLSAKLISIDRAPRASLAINLAWAIASSISLWPRLLLFGGKGRAQAPVIAAVSTDRVHSDSAALGRQMLDRLGEGFAVKLRSHLS